MVLPRSREPSAMKRFLLFSGLLAVFVTAWSSRAEPLAQAKAASAKVQYAKQILPILSANCFVCHGPDEKLRKAGLRLDVPELATKELKSGNRAIVRGKADESELIARIHAKTRSDRMPPAKAHPPLKDHEKQLLARWIDEGAEYQRHWAFNAPPRPAQPKPKNQGWAKNPIDLFVLARLEKGGLQPTPEADRYTLARRVSID